MEKRPFSTNQLLGIVAGCSLLAAVLCNAAMIPQSRPISVSYPSSSQAESLSRALETSSQSVSSKEDSLLVDINRASKTELEMLPGIGPAIAERIIDYREQNGAFQSPEDLTQVKGIGEKMLQKLLPYVTCG